MSTEISGAERGDNIAARISDSFVFLILLKTMGKIFGMGSDVKKGETVTTALGTQRDTVYFKIHYKLIKFFIKLLKDFCYSVMRLKQQ